MSKFSLTVDVEDYYHARNIELVTGRGVWSSLESRVDYSTRLVLELFAKHSAKGTFFVLGNVARKNKQLVKDIQSEGHEVASHGFRHHLAYQETEKAFFRDVCASRKLLADITGSNIKGYRAPNFSIKDENRHYLGLLKKAGYNYDSSLYPVWHPRYSNVGKPTGPHTHRSEHGEIKIYPLATLRAPVPGKNIRLPIAGGAYWRLFPFVWTKWALGQVAKENSSLSEKAEKQVFYLHPWEVDAGQPRIEGLGRKTELRHYGGIKKLAGRIDYFLKTYSSEPISEL